MHVRMLATGSIALGLAVLLLGQVKKDEPKKAEPIPLTHGPILGRPGATHMAIWARAYGGFQIEYGLAPAKLDQTSGVVQTIPERDFTGWVLLTNLKPYTKYFYRVVGPMGEGRWIGPTGSFRTLPDASAFKLAELNPRGLFNFRFEFACGNNQTPGQGGGPENIAFKTMLDHLKDKIDFAILNGD